MKNVKGTKTHENLKAALAAEIADWFETLAKAERSHAGRFNKALAVLDNPEP